MFAAIQSTVAKIIPHNLGDLKTVILKRVCLRALLQTAPGREMGCRPSERILTGAAIAMAQVETSGHLLFSYNVDVTVISKTYA
jgi:hypothetical protein